VSDYFVGRAALGAATIGFTDLDQDGDDDILVNLPQAEMSVLSNEGAAAFAAPAFLQTGVRGSFEVGDIDRDGRDDLVAFDRENAILWIGQGTSGFFRAGSTPTGAAGRGQLVDLNQDGLLDVVVIDVGGVRVLLGTGDPSFGATQAFGASNSFGVIDSAGGRDVEGLAFLDMDEDGDPDLAAAAERDVVLLENSLR